jgi:hypothetical protein
VLQKQYEAMLLEKIAAQLKSRSILPSSADEVKGRIEALGERIARLSEERRQLWQRLERLPEYRALMEWLDANAQKILKNYERSLFWWHLRYVMWAYLFLAPLFLALLGLHLVAKRRGWATLARLAAAAMGVVGLYMLFYLLWLVYVAIPKTFFAKLFAWLKKLDLEFLFTIITIAVATIFFWWLIARLQKAPQKKQSPIKRLYLKELRCGFCGAKYDPRDRYCRLCGEELWSVCETCSQKIQRGVDFCTGCGKRQVKI